jgi:hypothetical protein
VAPGSIAYWAVTQPPDRSQGGGRSSTDAVQMTRVRPVLISTDPVADRMKCGSIVHGRKASGCRPSWRMAAKVSALETTKGARGALRKAKNESGLFLRVLGLLVLGFVLLVFLLGVFLLVARRSSHGEGRERGGDEESFFELHGVWLRVGCRSIRRWRGGIAPQRRFGAGEYATSAACENFCDDRERRTVRRTAFPEIVSTRCAPNVMRKTQRAAKPLGFAAPEEMRQ